MKSEAQERPFAIREARDGGVERLAELGLVVRAQKLGLGFGRAMGERFEEGQLLRHLPGIAGRDVLAPVGEVAGTVRANVVEIDGLTL